MAIPLERGQTTLITTLNGGLAAIRRPRPGLAPKTNRSTSLLPISTLSRSNTERRFIGGANEQAVQKMFSSFRKERGRPGDLEAEALPDDDSDANSDCEDDTTKDTTKDYVPRRRTSYLQEYKLAAIEYFQTTWRKKKDGSIKRISVRRAARRLKIDCKSLCC